jgi:hypothetical protein
MEWLKEAPPVDGPRILFELYQKQLIAKGASEVEAHRELAVVRQMHRQRSDGWRVMFNNIYKTTKPGFATQPNALLVTTVEGRKTWPRAGRGHWTGTELGLFGAKGLGRDWVRHVRRRRRNCAQECRTGRGQAQCYS